MVEVTIEERLIEKFVVLDTDDAEKALDIVTKMYDKGDIKLTKEHNFNNNVQIYVNG